MTYDEKEIVLEDSTNIPSDVYTLRITDCKVGNSKKGNLMVITSAEIVAPDTITVRTGDKEQIVPIAGRRVDTWYNILDPTVPHGLGRLITGLKRAGLYDVILNSEKKVDTDNISLLVGKMLKAHVTCSPKYLEKEDENGLTVPVLDDGGNPIRIGQRLTTDWGRVVGSCSELASAYPY